MNTKLLLLCFLLPILTYSAEKDKGPKIIWNNIPKGKLPNGVQHLTFFSKAAKQDVGYSIYLPPSYKSNSEKRYPVIYNLHGNGGNELRGTFIAELLEKGIKAKKWPEMIMVFPNGGHSTFYKDSYDGKFPIETMFIKELIPHIDKTYRTIAARKGRCIEGFSMGGRGSTRLAMKYPEMFCSLFCQAGNVPKTADSFNPGEPDKHPNSYLGPNKQNYIDNDPYLLLKKNINQIKGKMRILIACGTKDFGHLNTVRIYHQALVDAKVDHTYIELEGLAHKMKKMIELMPNWFDYHTESLRRSGATK
ncbi:MAG: esterase family protein [Lentisphaeraceae bacterium]|nr:esterase family protein [Lentisphaeraceae bacterium]